MLLSIMEEKILLAIYTAKVNGGKKVELSDFDLIESDPIDQTHEFAYYCENLGRKKLITGLNKAFRYGMAEHPKYHNHAIICWPEELDIIKDGIEYVEKNVAT